MASQLKDNLTIIIPTHNREYYLRRSVRYWQLIDVRILIVDSSAKPAQMELPEHIEYHSFSGQTFARKVNSAMQMIDTPFVVMCPDDDFQTEVGLLACVEFLQSNNDYSAAQGRYVSFKRKDGNVIIRDIYRSESDFNVCGHNTLERVREGIFNYNLWYWSVHRSEILKTIYAAYDEVVNGNLIEIGVAIGHLAAGGHIQLPVFFQAREELPTSWGRVEADVPFDGKDTEDLSNWREKTKAAIAQLAATDNQKASEILTAAERAYSEFVQRGKSSNYRFYAMLQKYLPEIVYLRLVKLKRRVIGSGSEEDGYLPQKTYRWDAAAKPEWRRIMNTLEQDS